MPSLAPVELPRIEVGYEQLSPDVHRALETITETRTNGLFRVDGIGKEDLDNMRQVLKAAEGKHLPRHYYDEEGSYISASRTPVVEERHTRVFAPDYTNKEEDTNQLWLRVPAYSKEALKLEQEDKVSKKFIASMCVAGIAEYYSLYKGITTGETPYVVGFYASMSVGLAGVVHALRKSARIENLKQI